MHLHPIVVLYRQAGINRALQLQPRSLDVQTLALGLEEVQQMT
jgi:hypothetical protein